MYPLTIILIGFVQSYCPVYGKTVSGVFQSHTARENHGQYITRFLYHGKWLDLNVKMSVIIYFCFHVPGTL